MAAFTSFHPIVNLVYFVIIISFTMFIMHPLYLLTSFLIAATYILLSDKERRESKFYIYGILFFTTIIINPLINTQGKHEVYHFLGRSITLEALCYGVAIAMMIVAAFMWFQHFNTVMTSEKLIFLFGKIVPSFALTAIITLRLVPLFQRQIKEITKAQKLIGMDIFSGSISERLKAIVRILSILVTWALEHAIETADSMKARGYGSGPKTTFSIYTFTKRDVGMLCIMSLLVVVQLIAIVKGLLDFTYFPSINTAFHASILMPLCMHILLLCIPVLVEIKEKLQWHLSK